MEQSKPLARRQGYAMARSLSHFAESLRLDHSHSIGEGVVSDEDGIAIIAFIGAERSPMRCSSPSICSQRRGLAVAGLTDRKARLAKLLGRSRSEFVFNDHSDDDGATNCRGPWLKPRANSAAATSLCQQYNKRAILNPKSAGNM
jgi:hypothetical protein